MFHLFVRHLPPVAFRLRFVRANHISDGRTAQWTGTAVDSSTPVLHRAIIAHTHVSTHVQHRVDWILVANGAVDARWIVRPVV